MLVVWAWLINWLVTTIFVESHLFAPVRDWIIGEAWLVNVRGEAKQCGNKHWVIWPEDTTEEEYNASPPYLGGSWGKLAQLVTCQLCTRVWVGFAEAFVFGGPFAGRWYQYLADGLLYAAGGHLILELRSKVAA